MKRNTLKAAVILCMMCSLPSAAAEEALVSFKTLTPKAALVFRSRILPPAFGERGHN